MADPKFANLPGIVSPVTHNFFFHLLDFFNLSLISHVVLKMVHQMSKQTDVYVHEYV